MPKLVEMKILHPGWTGGNLGVFRVVDVPRRPIYKHHVRKWEEYRRARRRQLYANSHPIVLDGRIQRQETTVRVPVGTVLKVVLRQRTRRKKMLPFSKIVIALDPGKYVLAPACPDFIASLPAPPIGKKTGLTVKWDPS